MDVHRVVVFRRPADCRAFSLLELVLVLAIIGVMAAVAVPRFALASARYEAASAARMLAVDIGRAQRSARATSGAWRVVLDADGGGYTVGVSLGLLSEDPTRSSTTAFSGKSGVTERLKAGEVALESSVAMSSGVFKGWYREVETGRVEIDGGLPAGVADRTVVFNAHGVPDRSAVFTVRVGGVSAEVGVGAGGEVAVR